MKQSDNQTLFLVYLHRNKINSKCYVGQTIYTDQPNKRWRNGAGYITQRDFYEDILKYGWENFDHIILENDIPESLIEQRENYWINFYSCIDPEKGYNRKESGAHGHLSQEAKKSISDGWNQQSRKQQSARLKERWENDPVFKEKALRALQNAPRASFAGEKNGMYGVHRYGKQSPRHKQVQCINTGQIFNTIKQAAQWVGSVSQKSHISAVCKGTRNYAGKHPITKEPLKWKYYNQEDIDSSV